MVQILHSLVIVTIEWLKKKNFIFFKFTLTGEHQAQIDNTKMIKVLCGLLFFFFFWENYVGYLIKHNWSVVLLPSKFKNIVV